MEIGLEAIGRPTAMTPVSSTVREAIASRRACGPKARTILLEVDCACRAAPRTKSAPLALLAIFIAARARRRSGRRGDGV